MNAGMDTTVPRWLTKHRIDSEQIPYLGPTSDPRILRSLVVEHSAGAVQLIVPVNAMVDLQILAKALGKTLRVRIPSDHRETFSVCAVPGSHGLPIVLEKSIRNLDQCALATGHGDYFLLTRGELSDLVDQAAPLPATWKSYCEPLPPETCWAESQRDNGRITQTLSRFSELRIQQRLDETLHIPPLPEAARRIIALETNPDHDLQDLTRIIECDASLAARLMGWANSAFYALSTQVNSLEEAIMRVLGFEKVKSLALAIALNGQLNLPEAHVRGISPYWLNAVYAAATMEALVRMVPVADRPAPGLAYLAGLLSNFGTLVLGHVFPPHYVRICALQEANRHLPHQYLDQHVLGISREILCASLLESWRLPSQVTDAIRFQYLNEAPHPHRNTICLLQLTHQLLASRGVGDYPPFLERPGLAESLQLELGALEQVMQVIDASALELDGMAQLLSA